MDETEQFHLTIYAAGPVEALAERLAGIVGVTSVTTITGYWNTGVGVHSQQGAKIEGVADPPGIARALGAAQEWLNGSGEPALLLELHPTFARRLAPER